METTALKKRKNIDLPSDVFRSLSIMAASEGKNLKAFIESILISKANTIKEDAFYASLLKAPEANEWVSAEEKKDFENWLFK